MYINIRNLNIYSILIYCTQIKIFLNNIVYEYIQNFLWYVFTQMGYDFGGLYNISYIQKYLLKYYNSHCKS